MEEAAVVAKAPPTLESVYRAEAPGMWRALTLYARDAEIASDAVAEAFALALARGDAVRSPRQWVWKVAFRVANTQMRERARRVEPPPEMPSGGSASFVELWEALAELSPRQRGAVVLHYLEGYRLREIAVLLDSTTAAIGVHLHRARARLRALLKEESDD